MNTNEISRLTPDQCILYPDGRVAKVKANDPVKRQVTLTLDNVTESTPIYPDLLSCVVTDASFDINANAVIAKQLWDQWFSMTPPSR